MKDPDNRFRYQNRFQTGFSNNKRSLFPYIKVKGNQLKSHSWHEQGEQGKLDMLTCLQAQLCAPNQAFKNFRYLPMIN